MGQVHGADSVRSQSLCICVLVYPLVTKLLLRALVPSLNPEYTGHQTLEPRCDWLDPGPDA